MRQDRDFTSCVNGLRLRTAGRRHYTGSSIRRLSLFRMQPLIPNDARQLLDREPDALFIDCRSEMEYLFVGHPKGAHNVPWNDGPDWEVNPHFVQNVKKLAGHVSARPVLLICRSGNRSTAAARALEGAGFVTVYYVQHGFEGDLDTDRHRNTVNGWRHDGLPWEQY